MLHSLAFFLAIVQVGFWSGIQGFAVWSRRGKATFDVEAVVYTAVSNVDAETSTRPSEYPRRVRRPPYRWVSLRLRHAARFEVYV